MHGYLRDIVEREQRTRTIEIQGIYAHAFSRNIKKVVEWTEESTKAIYVRSLQAFKALSLDETPCFGTSSGLSSNHGSRACRKRMACHIEGCRLRFILPAILHSNSKSINIFAFLDEGSELTLVENYLAACLEVEGYASDGPATLHVWRSNRVEFFWRFMVWNKRNVIYY